MEQANRSAVAWHQRPPNFLEEYSSDSEYNSGEENAPKQPRILPGTSDAVQTVSAPSTTTVQQSRTEHIQTSGVRKPNGLGGRAHQSGRIHQVRKDNAAEARWRKRLPPESSYEFDAPYFEIVARLPGMAKHDPYKPLVTIGRRTRTFIRFVVVGERLHERKVDIWATSKQGLEDAIRELDVLAATRTRGQERIHSRVKKPPDKELPSVHPISAKKKAKLVRALEERAQLDFYRQEPNTANNYTNTGMFLWPADEIHPDNAFGSSHALLDHLRTKYHCFITFDRRRSVFRIYSDDDNEGFDNVRDVIQCLNMAFCECAAMKSVPLDLYLMRPLHSLEAKTRVKMVDACLVLGKDAEKTKTLIGSPMATLKSAQLTGPNVDRAKWAAWDQEMAEMEASNRAIIEKAVTDSLSRLVYRRGRIQMRTQIGLFAFSRYYAQKGAPDTATQVFIHNLGSLSTKGHLKLISLGIPAVEKLFKGIWAAADILEPLDTNAQALEDVKPVYSALFQFPQGRADTIKLRIAAAYVFNGVDGTYEISQIHWAKQSPTNDPPLRIHEVPLANHLTWKMDIVTDNILTEAKIPSKYTQFGDDVRLTDQKGRKIPIGQTGLMFLVPPFRDLQVNFRQKTTWQYRLKVNGSYIFEIARLDTFAVGTNIRSAAYSKAHVSSQWGFSLLSTTWEEKFAENIALQVGSKASWSPTLSTLFPPNPSTSKPGPDSGFDDYMRIVGDILAVLGAVLHEDPSRPDPEGDLLVH